jgi:hypothetical protein
MIPVVSLLVVLAVSLLVTRVATVALVHTGLGREAARFQARSAFTGVGFTTTDSEIESVTGHPVRRRIVFSLMLIGNVGIVAAMSSLLLSFLGLESGRGGLPELALLGGGVAVVWLTATSQTFDRVAGRVISWALRRFTSIDARDYARILHLREDYGVCDLRIGEDDWLAGRTLGESGVAREGLLVLGVECPGGSFIGAPPPETQVRAGDRLLLYGRTPRVAELDRRDGGSGEASHAEAVAEQDRIHRDERSRAGR